MPTKIIVTINGDTGEILDIEGKHANGATNSKEGPFTPGQKGAQTRGKSNRFRVRPIEKWEGTFCYWVKLSNGWHKVCF